MVSQIFHDTHTGHTYPPHDPTLLPAHPTGDKNDFVPWQSNVTQCTFSSPQRGLAPVLSGTRLYWRDAALTFRSVAFSLGFSSPSLNIPMQFPIWSRDANIRREHQHLPPAFPADIIPSSEAALLKGELSGKKRRLRTYVCKNCGSVRDGFNYRGLRDIFFLSLLI